MPRTQYVQLGNDNTMRAYVARPEGAGPHPGLLLLMEALGVNDQMRGVADRWAAEGFVVILPDLFHRTAPGFETDFFDIAAIMPLIKSLTIDGMIEDCTAAHSWLATDPSVDAKRIASLGFCLGGRGAYVANTVLPLAAAVSYYGSGIQNLTGRAASLSGPQLFFWGGRDTNIPPEQHRAAVDGVRAAGKPFVNVEFSEANHGFFNEQLAERYDRSAAEQSWLLARKFFQDVGVLDG